MWGLGKKKSRADLSDPVADAIYLWWDDMQGPHQEPVYLNIEKAVKLAQFLREKGFIKEPKK